MFSGAKRILTTAALALAAAACGETADPAAGPILVRDDAGREVTLDARAERVIALIPSVNEMLIALGAQEKIVARTDYDDAPQLAHLPSVGGGMNPSIEWLAATRPDLVVVWPGEPARSLAARLETLGIAVFAARVESIEDSYRTTRALGRLLGMEARADSLITGMRAEIAAAHARVAGAAPRRAVYLISLDPPLTIAEATSLAETLQLAGGENVFADVAIGQQQVSPEIVLQRNPDVVLVSTPESATQVLARLRGTAGWRDLQAVKAGRVHTLDPNLHSRPGPFTPRAVAELAALLHPERAGAER